MHRHKPVLICCLNREIHGQCRHFRWTSMQLLHTVSTLPYHNGTNSVIAAAVHTNHFLSITTWKVFLSFLFIYFSFFAVFLSAFLFSSSSSSSPPLLFSTFVSSSSRWLILFGLITFSDELQCLSRHPLQLHYFKRLHYVTMFSKPTKIIISLK